MGKKVVKDSGSVLNTIENSEEISAPTTDEASGSIARKQNSKQRVMSLVQIAMLLNKDRATVQKWMDNGCPYVQKADKRLNIPWQIDISEVVKWLEERAGDAAAERFGASVDGSTSEDEAKRRRAVAQAVVAELDMFERLRETIPFSYVVDLLTKDAVEIRDRVMTIPDALAGNVPPSVSKKVREIADEHCRNALSALKAQTEIMKKDW